MDQVKLNLIEAEKKAAFLFNKISSNGLIIPGKSEDDLNSDIFNLFLWRSEFK